MACDDMLDCLVTVSGKVNEDCITGEDLHWKVARHSSSDPTASAVINQQTGNLARVGVVIGSGDIAYDPAKKGWCFTTCELPVNSDDAPDSYYIISIYDDDNRTVETTPFYLDRDTIVAGVGCGGDLDIVGLMPPTDPEAVNYFENLILKLLIGLGITDTDTFIDTLTLALDAGTGVLTVGGSYNPGGPVAVSAVETLPLTDIGIESGAGMDIDTAPSGGSVRSQPAVLKLDTTSGAARIWYRISGGWTAGPYSGTGEVQSPLFIGQGNPTIVPPPGHDAASLAIYYRHSATSGLISQVWYFDTYDDVWKMQADIAARVYSGTDDPNSTPPSGHNGSSSATYYQHTGLTYIATWFYTGATWVEVPTLFNLYAGTAVPGGGNPTHDPAEAGLYLHQDVTTGVLIDSYAWNPIALAWEAIRPTALRKVDELGAPIADGVVSDDPSFGHYEYLVDDAVAFKFNPSNYHIDSSDGTATDFAIYVGADEDVFGGPVSPQTGCVRLTNESGNHLTPGEAVTSSELTVTTINPSLAHEAQISEGYTLTLHAFDFNQDAIQRIWQAVLEYEYAPDVWVPLTEVFVQTINNDPNDDAVGVGFTSRILSVIASIAPDTTRAVTVRTRLIFSALNSHEVGNNDVWNWKRCGAGVSLSWSAEANVTPDPI